MITTATQPQFLVWASSKEFGAYATEWFSKTALPWSVFDELSDLEQAPAGLCYGLVADGARPEWTTQLLWMREKHRWPDTPIVVLGGPLRSDLWTQRHLYQICDWRNEAELEAQLWQASAGELNVPEDRGAALRASYRHVCEVSAPVELELHTVDVSEGGVQLNCAFPIPKGMRLKVSLAALHAELIRALPIEVLRCRPAEPPLSGYRVHARFVDLSRDQIREMRKAMFLLQSRVARTLQTLTGK